MIGWRERFMAKHQSRRKKRQAKRKLKTQSWHALTLAAIREGGGGAVYHD